MLEIIIDFKENLYTKQILNVQKIPCICKISHAFEFDIEFLIANPIVSGRVDQWDLKEVDSRIPVGVGGEIRQFFYGLISISHNFDNHYIIDDLSIFDLWDNGWSDVIINREFSDLPNITLPSWFEDY